MATTTTSPIPTTNTVGYFNGNGYPIQINISALGRTFTLVPGGYITAKDSEGHEVKVNDPMFERYVGKQRLSKEVGSKALPIVCVVSRDEAGQINPLRQVPYKPDPEKKVVMPPPAPPNTENTVGPAQAIWARPGPEGIEAAIKRGLIKRPRPLRDSKAPVETDGAPLRGESLPEIEYADQDVARRGITRNVTEVPKVALPVGEQVMTLADTVPQSVKPVDTPDIEVPSLEEAERALVRTVVNVQDLATAGEAPEPVSRPSFLCEVCSPPKPFDFRSQLEAHAKKYHVSLVPAIMAKYPPKIRTAKVDDVKP